MRAEYSWSEEVMTIDITAGADTIKWRDDPAMQKRLDEAETARKLMGETRVRVARSVLRRLCAFYKVKAKTMSINGVHNYGTTWKICLYDERLKSIRAFHTQPVLYMSYYEHETVKVHSQFIKAVEFLGNGAWEYELE